MTIFSALVYVSGWSVATETLAKTGGLGTGFQSMGINTEISKPQQRIAEISGNTVGLNMYDGGTVGSKIATEFGVLGVVFLIIITFKSIIIAGDRPWLPHDGVHISARNISPCRVPRKGFVMILYTIFVRSG